MEGCDGLQGARARARHRATGTASTSNPSISPSPLVPMLTFVQMAEDTLPETTSPFPADSTFPAPSQQPTPVTAVPLSRLAMAPLAGRLTVLVKGLVLRKMPMDGTASSTGERIEVMCVCLSVSQAQSFIAVAVDAGIGLLPHEYPNSLCLPCSHCSC